MACLRHDWLLFHALTLAGHLSPELLELEQALDLKVKGINNPFPMLLNNCHIRKQALDDLLEPCVLYLQSSCVLKE